MGSMDDPGTYRVVVQARHKPDVSYTYILTRLDDPSWSHGTTIYYASPEAAAEAGRFALKGFLNSTKLRTLHPVGPPHTAKLPSRWGRRREH